MSDNSGNITFNERSPLQQLYISLLTFLGLGFFLMFIFLMTGMLIFGVDIELFEDLSMAADNKEIAFLKYILISQEISFFIIPGLIILHRLKPLNQKGFPNIKLPELKDLAFIVLLAFSLFPVTGFAGKLNSAMDLPGFMTGVEQWMINSEDKINRIFDLILTGNTTGGIIINLLMIALLPAIGEELIFRGVLQNILNRLFKSGHIAIWITAIFFSSIHLQFYGFLPRLILGLFYGYLFFWSGTLWLPVVAHFVNNAALTIGSNISGFNTSSPPTEISLTIQMSGLALSVAILCVIMNYFRKKKQI